MGNNSSLDKAKKLDAEDPLAGFRKKFVHEDPSVIYFDGNSLGKLPKATSELLSNVTDKQWGKELIDSWNKSWLNKNIEIGNKIASIIGAKEGEVIISDNTSINLYKLSKAAIQFQHPRKTIVSDNLNFPSDLYILQGIADEHGMKLEMVASRDEMTIDSESFIDYLNQDTGLVSLTHVAFKSAFMYDMEKITSIAHKVGALVLWDLSHSVGAVPLDMSQTNVDMAVGCTYKYLNGGPGAPAFLYVRKELQDTLFSPVKGWFGAANMFDFNLRYQPEDDIRRFLTGTPPIISQAAIEPGVDMIIDAGVSRIRNKSIQLSEYFVELYECELKSFGYVLTSPSNAQLRGSHISISHNEAFRITKALMDRSIDGYKIVPDFRAPHNIRFGFAPLYNAFEEIYSLVEKLKTIVTKKLYENYDDKKDVVT
jgi:kynureninase